VSKTKSASCTDRSAKSIAEQHPDFPAIEIGGYRIGPCVHGGWWVENEHGEGMQTDADALIRMLNTFWMQNF